jgi:hypothetical protein
MNVSAHHENATGAGASPPSPMAVQGTRVVAQAVTAVGSGSDDGRRDARDDAVAHEGRATHAVNPTDSWHSLEIEVPRAGLASEGQSRARVADTGATGDGTR